MRHATADASVGRFLAVTFGITWLCWGLRAALALAGVASVTDPISLALFFVGGFGPTVSALVVRGDARTWGGFVSFLLAGTRRALGWLLLIVALTFGASSAGLNPGLPLPALPGALLAAVTVSGGNEELGWRGVLQPELERRLPYPVATLVVGSVWAVRHLPFWVTPGDSHAGFPFSLFAPLAVLLSFWLAGLRRRGGSVALCCVLHGVANTLLSLFLIQLNAVLVVGLLALTALSLWMGMGGGRSGADGLSTPKAP